jgi:hypothetical protein
VLAPRRRPGYHAQKYESFGFVDNGSDRSIQLLAGS